MKKEVFLAVLVGFGLGLIITFGIWTANRNLRPTPAEIITSPTPVPTVSPDGGPASAPKVTLLLTTPDGDETFTNSNRLTLSGKTQAGNSVAVLHETGQDIVVADSSGNFFLDLTLEGGYNRISVTAFDAVGNSASKEILITYSTTKI